MISYLEVCPLISKYLEIFKLFFLFWFLILFWSENILYIIPLLLHTFTEICLMTQQIVYLGEHTIRTWKGVFVVVG